MAIIENSFKIKAEINFVTCMALSGNSKWSNRRIVICPNSMNRLTSWGFWISEQLSWIRFKLRCKSSMWSLFSDAINVHSFVECNNVDMVAFLISWMNSSSLLAKWCVGLMLSLIFTNPSKNVNLSLNNERFVTFITFLLNKYAAVLNLIIFRLVCYSFIHGCGYVVIQMSMYKFFFDSPKVSWPRTI